MGFDGTLQALCGFKDAPGFLGGWGATVVYLAPLSE